MTQENNQISAVEFLDCTKLIFEKTAGGFLTLKVNGEKTYDRVNLYRSFPLTKPEEYISVRDVDKNEIGLIRNVSDLSAEMQELVRFDLARRYFTPEITKISSLKDEYGHVYMNVETDCGNKHITVPNGSSNFIRLSEVRLMLVDIDGNRFSIPDYEKMDSKSVKLLETVI